MDGTATVVPRRENLDIVNVTQLDKESIIVCYDNIVRIVTPQGKLKINKKQVSELRFDFRIDSICKLQCLSADGTSDRCNCFFSMSSG